MFVNLTVKIINLNLIKNKNNSGNNRIIKNKQKISIISKKKRK